MPIYLKDKDPWALLVDILSILGTFFCLLASHPLFDILPPCPSFLKPGRRDKPGVLFIFKNPGRAGVFPSRSCLSHVQRKEEEQE